jgi:CheY-like chemotaxis protein
MKTVDASAQTSRHSLVFAEDDNLIAEVMSELLRSKGYEVHVAHDGLEAIQLIRQIKPALVILDIMMPKLDGSRVCWLVRQDPTLRNTPIVAFSSLSSHDFRYFPNLSADAYVAKGPVAESFQHVMQAIQYLKTRDHPDLTSGVFGYDHLKPRKIVGEMLTEIRRLASVLEALGPGTMELDREGRIVRASGGACEILRTNESQLVGELVTSLCLPSDRETLENLMLELSRATQPERCRSVLKLSRVEVPVQLCAIIERAVCTGIFLIMESKGSPAQQGT